jgi:hypothetical protein
MADDRYKQPVTVIYEKRSTTRWYAPYVRTLLPKDRVDLWDRCEADSWRPTRTGAYDWKLAEIALKRQLDLADTKAPLQR